MESASAGVAKAEKRYKKVGLGNKNNKSCPEYYKY
jgi:hypothetical protein